MFLNYDDFYAHLRKMRVSIPRLARLADVDRNTIYNWRNNGIPIQRRSRAYEEVIAAIKKLEESTDFDDK